ncbi:MULTISPECIES: site-specific integrase [Cyanophyceae]|uniref:tyrosine-type recombinase/integrase n=1 Tax=Cyanophyceae TaxID=3028117 RepID=UPI0002A66795|nr:MULTISPECIES: site-specific integrase [Cyanophyceae]AFZ33585.1 integrase family protein [Gloeocapsa sp. PCC 7428]PPS42087.1 integrase [Chroococcidiopsis sp. TS-821]
MKIDRHGRAKILTQAEIQLLFSQGLDNNRDRALFGICLYTACRINEACTLRRKDVFDEKRRVRPELIVRKGNTKSKLATRTIPVGEDSPSYQWFLFNGRHGKGHINPDSAARILRSACLRVGIEGASTHSFRRTALTMMSDAGIPLRIIQEVSGHRTLDELQKYLEVKPEQVRGVIAALSMLSHVGKTDYDDLDLVPDLDAPNREVDCSLFSNDESV